MSQADDPRILLGHIAGARGLSGEVRIVSYTAVPADIARYGTLESEDGTLALNIVSVKPAKSAELIARIEGVCDRTAAERLKGLRLYIPRSRLPATEADEFYVSDLLGLSAVAPGGGEIGKVIAVQNYGAGDLLEIRLSGTRKTELVPFMAAFVPEIDIAGGRITVVMPSFSDTQSQSAARQGGRKETG
jgi:16S rRNA processing protein RimM